MITKEKFDSGHLKLPHWFRQEVPDMDKIRGMKDLFRGSRLHTVCESANCPNMGACWKEGVATFMILGGTCTRACRFCAVPAGRPDLVDIEEPQNVALAVKQLGLRYVVVTSVARDDIEDEGALQFVKTIEAIRRLTPQVKIEVLIPDFSAKEASLKILSEAAPEVISHNIETVRRLSPYVRPQALHERSLAVLRRLRELNPDGFIKSSLMVGIGETDEEIIEVMRELRQTGCHILTIGQYLAPTQRKRHLPVERFLSPEEFVHYRQKGLEMGFVYVESGPLVRSSYIAEQGYQAATLAMAEAGRATSRAGSQQQMTPKIKKFLSIILPCFLSIALLTWLFVTIDYKHIWLVIKGSDMRYMSAAAIIFFSINFLMVWRWRVFMKAIGLKARRLSCMRWFLLGQFCNLAPISSVGSDVIRGLGLAQEVGHKPKIFASIVLDRLSGFAGIVILAAVAFLFGHGIIENKLVILAIAMMSIVSTAVVVVLFSHRIFSFACKAFASWPKVKDSLMRLHYDIVLMKGKQRQGWETILISVGSQIVLAVEFYLSAKGMHQNIPLVYFIIFSPIVCIVTALPSIGGLGFREISWVYLLPLVGVSKEVAGSLSLVNSAFTILAGLLGGLFYVTTLSAGRIQYPQTDPGLQGHPS